MTRSAALKALTMSLLFSLSILPPGCRRDDEACSKSYYENARGNGDLREFRGRSLRLPNPDGPLDLSRDDYRVSWLDPGGSHPAAPAARFVIPPCPRTGPAAHPAPGPLQYV